MSIAARHRVEGLVADGLCRSGISAPHIVEEQLRAGESLIAFHNVAMASETLQLQRAADEAGIKMIVLKGVTLNILAYGTLGVKKSWDIDLLIQPEQRESAFAMLRSHGYSRISPSPDFTEEQAERWMRLIKETVWLKADGSCAVELHTALTDSPYIIPGVSLDSPLQDVEVAPGRTVRTFQDSELFAYLCVHGATHGWARLKWLADVAAFLTEGAGRDAEALHRSAVELGAGRSSAQALLLCSDLLGISLPQDLEREFRSEAVTRWLVRVAIRAMNGRCPEKELDETMLGTARIQLSHFFLRKGLGYKIAETRLKLKNPAAPDLGRAAFLGPLVSFPHWIWRRSRMKR